MGHGPWVICGRRGGWCCDEATVPPWVLLFGLVWVNGRQRVTGSGKRATGSGRWAQAAGDGQWRGMGGGGGAGFVGGKQTYEAPRTTRNERKDTSRVRRGGDRT